MLQSDPEIRLHFMSVCGVRFMHFIFLLRFFSFGIYVENVKMGQLLPIDKTNPYRNMHLQGDNYFIHSEKKNIYIQKALSKCIFSCPVFQVEMQSISSLFESSDRLTPLHCYKHMNLIDVVIKIGFRLLKT